MSYTKTTNFAIKDTYLTGNPAKVIKGVEIDAEFDNLVTADGLNLKRDGSAAATADIPMGGNKLTGLEDGSTASDSITLGQVQNSNTLTIGSVSGTNTVTGTLTPSPAAYVTGQTFRFISAGANTGAVTLNLNGLGAKAITKNGATPLSSGDIPSAAVVQVTYDGTQFQLTSNVTVPPPATDYLNATRIDVASASTVDLTSSAPNTRHINITGTTTITGFTVAAGQCYFVRFDNALTLTSGASLVTQTGASITTVAGDTCILRATAANTVEVLSYCRVQRLTSGTAITTTSGTSHDFTGIPSWVKRITVMLNGVSTNGTSGVIVRIGAGSVDVTGYLTILSLFGASTVSSVQDTTGALLDSGAASTAATVRYAQVVFNNLSGNVWTYGGSLGQTGGYGGSLGGAKTLSGTLDRIRLTTVNGTDTFDAGTFNIMYEG